MSSCEMCGKSEDALVTAQIAGAELDVCDSCSDMGTVIDDNSDEADEDEEEQTSTIPKNELEGRSTQPNTTSGYNPAANELIFDYGPTIRNARNRMGLTIDELAMDLDEKPNSIRRVENEDSLPSEELRKKLENALDINLLQEN